MKKSILFLSIICASGLTMVSIYNTIIDAQSWGSDIPTSIQTARDYYQHVDPRRFFSLAGPVNEALILLTPHSVLERFRQVTRLFWDSVGFVCGHRHPDSGLLRSARSHPVYVADSGSSPRNQSGLSSMESHELASLIARFGRSSLFIQRPRHVLQGLEFGYLSMSEL
jgi:hypothetical protein